MGFTHANPTKMRPISTSTSEAGGLQRNSNPYSGGVIQSPSFSSVDLIPPGSVVLSNDQCLSHHRTSGRQLHGD